MSIKSHEKWAEKIAYRILYKGEANDFYKSAHKRFPRRRTQTIGVAGVMPRIGTTTQALQLVQYLQRAGYQAAYIERNSSFYSQNMLALYKGARKMPKGVWFQGVPMYGNEFIQEEKEEQYDFFVKDYGSVRDTMFEEISFLEQDKRFLVCGVKANELTYTEEALEKYGNDCCGFWFSFVASKDRAEIVGMMREKKKLVHFSEYIPDPFLFHASSAAAYQALFLSEGRRR